MNELKMTLCLSNDSILISQDILEMLGSPRQIQMLFHDEKKQIVLRACGEDDCSALVVAQKKSEPFTMSGRVILGRLKKILKWEDECPRLVFGSYNKDNNVVLFNLNNAIKADTNVPPIEMGE